MSASIITNEEFATLRESREREKKLKKIGLLSSPEKRTEKEEMDILAIVMEQFLAPSKKYPGSVVTRFSLKKETWETNPIAGIFRNVAEFAGYDVEETLFGRVVDVTVRKSYQPKKEEDDEE